MGHIILQIQRHLIFEMAHGNKLIRFYVISPGKKLSHPFLLKQKELLL